MKKVSSFFLNLMIFTALGILVSLFVLAIVFMNSGVTPYQDIINILPLLVAAVGLLALILTLFFTKRAYTFCISLLLIFWGLFIFFLDIGVIPFTLGQWWPLLGISGGLVMFVTGCYYYRKVKIGYAIPALVFFLMGVWFMLFSFKIIKVSFRVVAAIGGPLLVIMACLFLMAIFLIQQKYKKLVISEDEPDDFQDDIDE